MALLKNRFVIYTKKRGIGFTCGELIGEKIIVVFLVMHNLAETLKPQHSFLVNKFD